MGGFHGVAKLHDSNYQLPCVETEAEKRSQAGESIAAEQEGSVERGQQVRLLQ